MKRYEPDERVILTPLNLPRVRHRRKEAAAVLGIIVAVVVLVTYGVLAIVYQLA